MKPILAGFAEVGFEVCARFLAGAIRQCAADNVGQAVEVATIAKCGRFRFYR